MASVLSVNLSAHARTNPDAKAPRPTGIDKRPTREAVMVRAPGPMRSGLGSGLVGDTIGNQKLHGGDDQAVYAYAREDLDEWAARLDRPLSEGGMFGENLTTSGVDVTGALIGERWRVGTDGLLLEVSAPRTPCRTFSSFLDIRGVDQDVHRSRQARRVSAGDHAGRSACRRQHRHRGQAGSRRDDRLGLPRPDVGPPSLLPPQLLPADALSAELKAYIAKKTA